MLTVKDLKEQLKNMPDDAIIVGYSAYDEGDTFFDEKIFTFKLDKLNEEQPVEYDEYCAGTRVPYYCKGDSAPEFFVINHPNLQDTTTFVLLMGED